MVVYTAVQPTGIITLGNYIGAIKKFEKHLTDDSYLCIANLHALTIPKDGKEQLENIKTLIALYGAMGLDKKTKIFLQSNVEEHTSLTWVLSCFGKCGELERMTQYKDKSSKNISASIGLFTYPILMASDILLYDATHIPVGQDQKQHLELTRDLAIKFNNFYKKEIFTLPEPIIEETGNKIYSLIDPSKKMSKSDENVNSYISLLDDKDLILKKIKSATTDSIGKVNYDPINQPGVSNLLVIYSELNNISIIECANKFKDYSYKDFKEAIGENIVEHLVPIQEKYKSIINDENKLKEIINKDLDIIKDKARKKMNDIYEVIGMKL